MAEPEHEAPPDEATFSYAGCRVTLVDAPGILAAAATGRVELLHGAAFPPPVQQVRFTVGTEIRDGQRVHLLDGEIDTGLAASSWDRSGLTVLGSDPIGVLLSRRLAAGDPWTERIVDGVGNAAAEAYRWLGRARGSGSAGVDGAADVAAPTVLEDVGLGLRATVTNEELPPSSRTVGGSRIVGGGRTVGGGRIGGGSRIVAVRAAVASDDISAAHLRAMFRLILGVVTELTTDVGGPDVGGPDVGGPDVGGPDVGGPDVGAAQPLAGRSYVLSRQPGDGPIEDDRRENVDLDQVGGLSDVVAQFRQIAVSFRHPSVMARWGARRPQGILLYGPPGTGKTMLARALANEIGARFREIRTTEILDKWLGASERNIKRIFRDARRYREPTVLLFDEFDSIISYVGGGGDAASQAVNAVAGIFKQEMNNLIEENPNVIVVATTNFPDRVDDSLIRSGRFDIKIAIPLPDEAGRTEIIAKMIGQLKARHEVPGFQMFADGLDPAELARASDGMTGADIREVLRRVRLAKAMAEARTGVAGPIAQADLLDAVADLRRAGA